MMTRSPISDNDQADLLNYIQLQLLFTEILHGGVNNDTQWPYGFNARLCRF